MNQSEKKNKTLTIPVPFDISVSMKKAIEKVEDEFRMSLGLTAAINESERNLMKLANNKKSKENGNEPEQK